MTVNLEVALLIYVAIAIAFYKIGYRRGLNDGYKFRRFK